MISMKVCKTDVNKISLHSIILQLQLTLELSQFKEILSVYSDLLVLVANYSFIFENSSSEIQALKENPVSVETALISQDPIRDGFNWYAYCSNNPLTFTDPLGLYPRKPTPLMGVQAHKSIIQQLKSQDLENGIIAGPQIYLPNPDGGKKGGFFVDYSRKDSEGNKEFYEIKPISYMKNQRGDKQLEKYIDRDGKAVKGMELMSTIQNMEPIETIMSTPLGNEKISIQLTVDPVNHPGMIFYELDDGRTPKEEALKVAEKIIVPVINAALIVIGAGVEIPQMPTVPEPVPVLP